MSNLNELWNMYTQLILSSSSKKVQLSEVGRWNNHIMRYFGNIAAETITNQDILRFRANLVDKDLSPQTVSHCLSLLHRVLHRGLQWGLIDCTLPIFEMPRFDNKRVRFLTKEEANILLSQLKINSELWHDISLLSLHTGLRASEIFSLRNEHFNKDLSILYINDTKSNNNRTVPLNEISRAVIVKNLDSNGYIFKERNAQITSVNRIFNKSVAECRLNIHIKDRRQRVVFHTLRHTFASWLVQSGVTLQSVGELLGHKTLSITMRYAHLSPSHGSAAVKLLEQFAYLPKFNPTTQTINGKRRNKSRVNWFNVDWSKKDAALASELGVTPQAVWMARKRYTS